MGRRCPKMEMMHILVEIENRSLTNFAQSRIDHREINDRVHQRAYLQGVAALVQKRVSLADYSSKRALAWGWRKELDQADMQDLKKSNHHRL